MAEERIPCPDCGELILPNAIKCRYCGKNISRNKEKSKKHKVGRIFILIFACLGIIFSAVFAFLFYTMKYVDNKFTGQELFDAVNEYRVSKGLQQLTIDQRLCINLDERWLAIHELSVGHDSPKEWAIKVGLVKDGELTEPYDKNVGLAELFANGTQTYWLIDSWENSPDSKKFLENPDYNVGCSYASEGTGVIIMAKK